MKVTLRPESCGKRPVEIAGSQTGEKPVEERLLELRPGERLDHRPVPERQDREHLAPRDLARRLAADGGEQFRSARSPPELVYAASTPGYFARIASATMFPIADSSSRVGARLMSAACVPIDAVAQDRRLGVRVIDDRLDVAPLRDTRGPSRSASQAPVQATSPRRTSSWSTE